MTCRCRNASDRQINIRKQNESKLVIVSRPLRRLFICAKIEFVKRRKITSKEYLYTVIYEPLKKGGYHVVVPMLPGIVTYGRDFEEAQAMARDAIRCHLEGLMKEQNDIPSELGLLQERVAVTI